MGTIFLVIYIDKYLNESTTVCSLRSLRSQLCVSVVCQINCVGGITFRLRARAAFSMTKKKRSLRNEKLKANRASETEGKKG